MRIAYVCVDPGIPVFGTKGASVHIQEVVRQMRRRGHEVTVYAARRGTQVPADLAGLELVEVPVPGTEPAERERGQRLASERIAELLRRTPPELVYERYSLFSTVLADAHEALGVPGVLEVNAPLIDEQREHRVLVDEDGAVRALQRQAGAAAATICVSDPVRDWVRSRTATPRARTVANGVDVERILPQPEEPGVPVVLFVGTLKPWHGVSDLLSAAGRAEEPWRLRIVGDGPEREALERQAERLGLEVDFRGAVAPERMPEHLAGAAIGVAPYPRLGGSERQYFSPMKVYEYLAAGLPVVASEVGQLPAILGELGGLVPPSDPDALAAAIDALARDPERRARLGTAGRILAERRHSWSGVVSEIFEAAGLAGG
ncbi:MAG: glycosyltransferase family 4 protein [Pseudoclavibacter sp.]|nr:glycosyltransferase family 4 protein [Pseudoclavibacter sp.]